MKLLVESGRLRRDRFRIVISRARRKL